MNKSCGQPFHLKGWPHDFTHHDKHCPPSPLFRNPEAMSNNEMMQLDLMGLHCPHPLLKTKKALASIESQGLLEIHASDPSVMKDFPLFCEKTGHRLISQISLSDAHFQLVIQKK